MEDLNETIQKLSILVVDDMETMRSMVKSCVRELGVEHVFMAKNGEMAWGILANKRIDLIICDWDMPEVSGLELLKRVKTSEIYSHMPFLMLTATINKENVLEAIKAGADDYLAKPFQSKDLEYRVIKLLRKVRKH